MKKRKKITAKVGLVLLMLAALAIIVLPLHVWASDDDLDNDGILDWDEGLICLPIGTQQNCYPTNLEKPDLFVMLLSAEASLLPQDPFVFITEEHCCFDINLHVISEADAPTQAITETQYAVALIEDLSTNDGDLGTSQIGTPAQRVSGRVFPQRILDDVENACSLQPNCECVNSAGDPVAWGVQDIFNFYSKNVVAHEIFHMLGRVVPRDRKLDYHYAQLGYIMDHHMYYKVSKKNNTVTWHITDTWSQADVPRFK